MSTTTLDPTVVAPPQPPRSALPPGPRAPGIVQALQFARNPLASVMAVHRRYGEPFTVNSPGFGTTVIFSSPELVKQVVAGDPQIFHAGLANAPIKPILGRGRCSRSTARRTCSSASCCRRRSTASGCAPTPT